jgi:hypothetical protein
MRLSGPLKYSVARSGPNLDSVPKGPSGTGVLQPPARANAMKIALPASVEGGRSELTR